jgi:hypothetical protein
MLVSERLGEFRQAMKEAINTSFDTMTANIVAAINATFAQFEEERRREVAERAERYRVERVQFKEQWKLRWASFSSSTMDQPSTRNHHCQFMIRLVSKKPNCCVRYLYCKDTTVLLLLSLLDLED